MDTLGQRLKFWRESENLSIYDLANLTSIEAGELNLLETDRSLPTWDSLNKLRIYTQMDFRWFLLGTTEPMTNHLVYD